MSEVSDPPKLAAPGAGLPWHQEAFGRYLWLPYLSAISSWEQSSQRFQDEGRRMLELVAPLDAERMTRRVLVEPLIGIEDSSRYWSAAMVLEHLVIVGDIVAEIVVALSHDRDPPFAVQIADLKPSGRLTPEQAMAGYRDLLGRYERRMREEAGDRDAERRWPHPWFGRIGAHQWHCLAGLHQRLHRRQIGAILKGLEATQHRGE